MTLRALIAGFLGAMFIAGFGYINDRVFRFESFTGGHLVPTIVIGLVFLVVIVLNPLLSRVRKAWLFRPAEMALVVVLMMTACSIPAGGLLSTFTQALVMPFHWNQGSPGWQESKLLDYAPKRALVDATDHDGVVTAFIQGAPDSLVKESLFEATATKLRQVPWASWRAPLLTWLPMVFLTAIASASLMLVVHRQWSTHECLSYPIADFTASLLARERGETLPAVLRNRVFWTGFVVIFLIRLNNAAHAWYPDFLIPVRTVFDFRAFGTIWPSIHKVPLGGNVLILRVYPLVIAFAFFLSTEISLTLGLTQILWVMFTIPLVTMGVTMGTQYGKGGWGGWQRASSYVATALMLFYTGRHYYKATLARALVFWRRHEPGEGSVWACRIFLVSTLLLIVLTMGLGLELPFAVGTIGLMLISFLVVSRISAETGLFWIHPRWQPFGALLGLFGCYAMKPEAVVISALICVVLCINQGEVLMPYLCNGLKLCEKVKLSVTKVTSITLVVYVVGVLLAVVVVLAASYDAGTPIDYGWSYKRIPTMPFRDTEPEIQRLKANGLLSEAEQTPWYSRMKHIQPRKNFLWAAGFGFVAVIVFSALRLRFARWPIHPSLFLLWATWPMVMISSSFLLGWIVKKATVHYGGSPMVKKLKPFMVGIIAGELAGAFLCMLAGALYYAVTGDRKPSYIFIP